MYVLNATYQNEIALINERPRTKDNYVYTDGYQIKKILSLSEDKSVLECVDLCYDRYSYVTQSGISIPFHEIGTYTYRKDTLLPMNARSHQVVREDVLGKVVMGDNYLVCVPESSLSEYSF